MSGFLRLAAFAKFIGAVPSPVGPTFCFMARSCSIVCVRMPRFVYFITIFWTSELFPFFACYENSAVNICVHIFVWTPVFSFHVATLGFHFLRHCRIIS